MRCPECGAEMDAGGTCPSCGHLVVTLEKDNQPESSASFTDKASAKSGPQAPKRDRAPVGSSLNLTGSWDFSVWLLAITIYSILLHPTLIYLVFMRSGAFRLPVLVISGAYIPVAYLLTRLLCVTDSETGRLKIRNPFLRKVFKKLNSLTIRLQ